MKLGNLATGDDFFGRETECEDFWRYIEEDHLVLSGPRRLGKSSLINRWREQAEAHGLMAQHIDVQDISTCEDFLDELDHAFPDTSLKAFLAAAGDNAARWLNRFHKIEARLPGGGGVAVELNHAGIMPWRGTAEKLEARLGMAPVLILIDEFSVFLENLIKQNKAQAESLLAWLRAWRVRPAVACRFLFSGSIGLNALLEHHGLATSFNDCHQFVLEPFRPAVAQAMLDTFATAEGWPLEPAAQEHLCRRVGWLSPFYLCLLLDESRIAARDRRLESGPANQHIEKIDVDDGYERLLTSRSRFYHWEKRLGDHLQEPELSFCKAILTLVARAEEGLSLRQLLARLAKREPDPDQRAARLQTLLVKLAEEGYLSQPDVHGRVRYLSFLLRDWWRRNHA